MSRIRRSVVPTVLLMPVILVFGKLLLTPNRFQAFDFLVKQRGWPWVFYETGWTYLSPLDGPADATVFHFWPFIADFAIALCFLIAAALLLTWHYRRRGRWLQFSLRELMLVMAVAGGALGWWVYEYSHWQRQNAQLAKLSQHDVVVEDWTAGPKWAKRLVGNDKILDRADALWCQWVEPPPLAKLKETWVAALEHMPSVRRLTISVSDSAKPLREDDLWFLLPFEEIELEGMCDDETVQLFRKLPRLRKLWLNGCQDLTDQGLRNLTAMDNLDYVSLPDFPTSDETVELLKQKVRVVEVGSTRPLLTDDDDEISSQMVDLLKKKIDPASRR